MSAARGFSARNAYFLRDGACITFTIKDIGMIVILLIITFKSCWIRLGRFNRACTTEQRVFKMSVMIMRARDRAR